MRLTDSDRECDVAFTDKDGEVTIAPKKRGGERNRGASIINAASNNGGTEAAAMPTSVACTKAGGIAGSVWWPSWLAASAAVADPCG